MVNYHVLNESVVLNYNGKTVVISNGDKRFQAVIDCIKTGDLNDIPCIVEIEKSFEGTGIELRDGLLWEGENPMPSELSDRILKFKELGLPYDTLFKFWDNLKKNPSFNARKMMFKFLEHNGIPLTQDGCFIAYRGVSEDFKDKHTGRFDNRPGSVCEMDRNAVDDNPNNTCSSGLHVACYDYAKGFGERLVEVKVNPSDVVAVPTDYNGTKMRTCKFEVVQECEKIREELVYGQPNRSPADWAKVEDSPEADEGCKGCDECDEPCEDESDDDHCENCGEERNPFANFCGECGNEF